MAPADSSSKCCSVGIPDLVYPGYSSKCCSVGMPDLVYPGYSSTALLVYLTWCTPATPALLCRVPDLVYPGYSSTAL